MTTINQQHINRLGEGDTIIAVLSQVTTINQQHNNRLGEGDTIIAVLSQNRQWAPRVSRRGGGERRPDCPNEENPRWGQDLLNIGIFCKSLPPLSLFQGAEIHGLLFVRKFVILVKTTT